jgi:hypothetical protein
VLQPHPHLCRFVQPLDVGVHRALREYLKHTWCFLASNMQDYTKQQIIPLVMPAIAKGLCPANVMAGWKKAGLIPLDPGPILERVRRKLDKQKATHGDKLARYERNRESKGDDGKAQVEPAAAEPPPDAKTAQEESDKKVEALFKVPDLPKKQHKKKGGRPSPFQDGAELTSATAMATLQALEDKRGNKRRNREPCAWVVEPDTLQVYGQRHDRPGLFNPLGLEGKQVDAAAEPENAAEQQDQEQEPEPERKGGREHKAASRRSGGREGKSKDGNESEDDTEAADADGEESDESEEQSEPETEEDEKAAADMEVNFAQDDEETDGERNSREDFVSLDVCMTCFDVFLPGSRRYDCDGDCAAQHHLKCFPKDRANKDNVKFCVACLSAGKARPAAA